MAFVLEFLLKKKYFFSLCLLLLGTVVIAQQQGAGLGGETRAISNNIISSNQIICFGERADTISGTVANATVGFVSYAWQDSSALHNWADASGSNTNQSYFPGVVTTNTWYRRIATALIIDKDTSNIVMVEVIPEITNNVVGNNQAVCEGGTALGLHSMGQPLGGDGAFAFQWIVSTDSLIWTSAIAPNNMPDYSTGVFYQDTYFARIVESSGCYDTSNVVLIHVIAGSTPIVGNTISADQTLCPGQTPTDLIGSLPSGGNGTSMQFIWIKDTTPSFENWWPADPVSYTLQNLYFNSPADTSFYYNRLAYIADSVYGVACPVPSNTLYVEVLNIDNDIHATDTLACPGVASGIVINGSVNASSTYQWEYNNGGGWVNLSGNSPSHNVLVLNVTTSFRRIIVAGSCNDTSNVVTIYVSLPIDGNTIIADPSVNDTVCRFMPVTVISNDNISGGSGVYQFEWQTSTDGITWITSSVNNGFETFVSEPLSSHTYFRRIVRSVGCPDSSISNVVYVYALQPINGNSVVFSDLVINKTICYEDMVIMSSIGSPGGGNGQYSYEWESSNDNQNWQTGVWPYNNQWFTSDNLTDTTWFRRIVFSGSCIDTSNIIVANVLDQFANTIGYIDTICPGGISDTLRELAAIPYANVIYQWEKMPQSTGVWETIAGADMSFYVPGFVLDETTSFRRSVRIGGCDTYSNIIQLFVISLDNNLIADDQTLCNQGTAQAVGNAYTPSLNFTYDIEWYKSIDSSSWDIIPGVNGEYYDPGLLLQTHYFQRNIRITGGACAGSQQKSNVIKVNVVNIDSAFLLVDSILNVCGLNAHVVANPVSSGNGQWFSSPSGLDLLPQGDAFNLTVNASDYGNYELIWEVSEESCFSLDRMEINFFQQPVSAYAGPDQTLSDTSEVMMNANEPAYGFAYWTIVKGSGTIADTADAHTFIYGLMQGENVFRWNVVNGPCESRFDDIAVNIDNVKVPEGFSPNGDGVNDFFIIGGIEQTFPNEFHVFNRWGEEVFSEEDYNNDWEGVNSDGQSLPDDTYFYILKIKDDQVIKGYVVIKR